MVLKLTRLSVLCLLAMGAFCVSPASSYADEKAKSAVAAEASESDDATVLVAANSEVHDEEDVVGDHDHPAAADGHDSHANTPPLLSFDIGSAVCNIAIFLGVFAILSKFVWPPILSGLKAREDKISGDLENAERINAEARSLLSDYQTKLDEAANQVQGMLAEARRDAETNGQRIVADAKAEAERTRDRAVADIETAKKVALADLAGQTSDMAMQVAKSVVGRELRPEDHADLIRQSLDRLPSNN
ncbi:ATP synthase subunit b precursor [Novipirellula galeiformis]|uniref:ATP synthase subunit b n=1 Tax=Novipirellula galeiformis TaxID=2528004 RepID=A0A5C6CTB3_9BACT|nr:F0F1 ATP synthase subunit B [Novipirellula galeiformis]TWU26661.1 ATP synthase subunit b precursor [Novipirellula galeiformis]